MMRDQVHIKGDMLNVLKCIFMQEAASLCTLTLIKITLWLQGTYAFFMYSLLMPKDERARETEKVFLCTRRWLDVVLHYESTFRNVEQISQQ